ncbi:MAG: hypothetical protein ACTTIS_06795 [Streptobacillus sp.]
MKKYILYLSAVILPLLNFGAEYSNYTNNQNSTADIQKSMAAEKYNPINEWDFNIPEQLKQAIFYIPENEYNKQSLLIDTENITEKINSAINLETDKIMTYFSNNNYKNLNTRSIVYNFIFSKYSLELFKELNNYENNKWINNVDNRLYISTTNNDLVIFEYDYSTKKYSKLYKIEINVNKTNNYAEILNEVTYNVWKSVNSYMNRYVGRNINKSAYLENFIVNEKVKINRTFANINIKL